MFKKTAIEREMCSFRMTDRKQKTENKTQEQTDTQTQEQIVTQTQEQTNRQTSEHTDRIERNEEGRNRFFWLGHICLPPPPFMV